MDTRDSVPVGAAKPAPDKSPLLRGLFLFFLFVLATSDLFVQNGLRHFKGGVSREGVPTPFGNVVQGVFLVIAYITLTALSDLGAL
jgi:hypothetical protein